MLERWYQEEAIASVFSYFDVKSGNPVIAMPTASGKSHVIGGFTRRVLTRWPTQRFMILTHVKELIEQNARKQLAIWPNAPIGVYSAGLDSRDTAQPIIFGGVQSVVNSIELFGHRDLLWIDEAHLLSPDENSQYQHIIRQLKKVNPFLKVIGTTATPFRLGQGMITDEGGIFTDICYDLTGVEAYNRLIAEGYLAPIIPKRTRTELDVSGVGISNTGDFVQTQLQKAVNKEEVTYAALCEAVSLAHDRRCWIVFASGIEHAENIAAMLNSFGISAAAVHSKSKPEFRDRAIIAHKRGELRALVGNNVFTTGYDNPLIDCLVDLQPTVSVVKHVQKYGRGSRVSHETGKRDCLGLDFAKNVWNLGPINDPHIPNRKSGLPGEAPVKICDTCGTYNHTRAEFCICCGAQFEFAVKIVATSSTAAIIKSDLPVVEYFNVDHVFYNRYIRAGSPPMIKVSYACDMRTFNEFICLDHPGYTSKRARDWWRARHQMEPPVPKDGVTATDIALHYIAQLRKPRRIRVWVNKAPHPEVLSHEW